MDRLPFHCRDFSQAKSKAVVEEGGKKYTLTNRKKEPFLIDQYRIDGCVSQGEGEKRCDYLFLIENEPKMAIFIELKGGDLNQAVKQLRDTLKFLKPNLPNHVYKARIVGSRSSPNLKNATAYQQLIQLLNGVAHFKYATNRKLSENIETI